MILTPEDMREFHKNAREHGSLCPALRKGALSCHECTTHGPCRVAEYYDWKGEAAFGKCDVCGEHTLVRSGEKKSICAACLGRYQTIKSGQQTTLEVD